MKLAVAVWNDQLSPMLDAATTLAVFEVEEGQVVNRLEFSLDGSSPVHRAASIIETGARVLICGAVSNPLAFQLQNRGIELVPWITGTVDEVMDAYLSGNLPAQQFTMPGCRRGRGGRRQRRRQYRGRGNRQW